MLLLYSLLPEEPAAAAAPNEVVDGAEEILEQESEPKPAEPEREEAIDVFGVLLLLLLRQRKILPIFFISCTAPALDADLFT